VEYGPAQAADVAASASTIAARTLL
jgi:hypothetical protein